MNLFSLSVNVLLVVVVAFVLLYATFAGVYAYTVLDNVGLW